MIKKYINRFPFAISGIWHALINDFGFRTQVYLGIAIAFFIAYFFEPLSEFEFLFLSLAYVLVLITELQNSALESAIDSIYPEQNEGIKHSKDMAAGSVLIAGAFLFLVLAIIGYSRIGF
ncbi:diacylglycerol kinase [Candidatus Nomurabacteria bacterium]|nr:diacylglycerol kinase [Candidatus Kaiserbacteria bacterium]MCB9810275.1 diacylglycerol kinase [Candidatus Nomurabacteria bacterium]